MEIIVSPREPGASQQRRDGSTVVYEWLAVWQCPGCHRRTVETSIDEPTPAQLTAIQDDPMCWQCRQKQLLPVFKP